MPDLAARPLGLEFWLNGEKLQTLNLSQNGWTKVDLEVNKDFTRNAAGLIDCLFEIRADRTWQPRSTNPESSDDRELSIAVCNLMVLGNLQYPER